MSTSQPIGSSNKHDTKIQILQEKIRKKYQKFSIYLYSP